MLFKDGEPDLSQKQKHLLALCRRKTGALKYVLVSGTRLSGKTIGCSNAIAQHLWETKNGSALVLCYTAGTAATSGIWTELTEKVLPEWIAAGFGMEWAGKKGEPRIHGATKKMMCAVINKYGGVSKLELDSLDDEREVEKRYKSRYYSLIYWSEAGEFQSELSMSTLMLALRVVGLPDDEHLLLIDTNPPESGENHFLYKFFYELRIADDTNEEEKNIQKCLHLTEWTMDDNPYLTPEKIAVIKSIYRKSPALYSRYIEGKWVRVVEKGLFIKQFSRAQHIVGQPDEKDPEMLIPMDGCTELYISLDAGGVNPVAYIGEKCILHEEKKEISIFRFLDELAFIGEPISVEEFTKLLMVKMEFWEQEVGTEISWQARADMSALNFKESIANRTVADEMYAVSGGKIDLVGVDKGRGSVGNRIRLWRKLLVQGRVVISGSKCPKLLEMCENIQPGKTPDSVGTHSTQKHPFDAGTYWIAKEAWNELQDNVMAIRNSRKEKQHSGLISVGM
jgi:PBSX family phage terminase large subunit